MLSRVLNVFRVADLRMKILFTLSMIALYRLGSFIPAPGVDIEAVQTLRDSANRGGILSLHATLLGRRAYPVRDLRVGDHALYHLVDHHADPRCGDTQDRAVAAARRGGSAQDNPVDPVHDCFHCCGPIHQLRLLVPQWRLGGLRWTSCPSSTLGPCLWWCSR